MRRYRMVVGVDLSEYSEIVLEHALDQAARHEAPELHLVTVRERKKESADELNQALWERAYPALEAFNRFGRDWRARLHVRLGKPEEQIAQLAAEVRADLIVIGTFGLHHGGSLKNVPNTVIQNAVCPTLVVGMPDTIDAKQCPVCVALREATEGDQWFCDDHADSYDKHAMTPMTVWTGGQFSIARAA
ncbi:MAG: universal stress protein [Kofleriaceae bacterium]